MNRKLYRSTKDKMVGGVAGGLAEYFEIDPTIVRVLFVVSLFLGGAGIIAYLILWIIVPERPFVFNMPSSAGSTSTEENSGEPASGEVPPVDSTYVPYQEFPVKQKKNRSFIGGIVLIIIGFFFLADELFPRVSFEHLISLVLIIIGVALLINATKK